MVLKNNVCRLIVLLGFATQCGCESDNRIVVDKEYQAGDGLSLDSNAVPPTFNVDFAGPGLTTTASRSDHNHALSELSDVSAASPAVGDVLSFDTIEGWTHKDPVADLGLALTTHNHNTDYYTKGEVDAALVGKSNTSHTHVSLVDASASPVVRVSVNSSGAVKIGTNGTSFLEIRELTGTLGESGSTLIDLPTGYTIQNTRVLSCEMLSTGNQWWQVGYASATSSAYYRLISGSIQILWDNAAFNNQPVRAMLMRMP